MASLWKVEYHSMLYPPLLKLHKPFIWLLFKRVLCLSPPQVAFCHWLCSFPSYFQWEGSRSVKVFIYFILKFFYSLFSNSKLSVLCHLNLLRNIEFSPKPVKEADVAFWVKDYTSSGCGCTKKTEAGGTLVQGQLGLLGSFQFSLGERQTLLLPEVSVLPLIQLPRNTQRSTLIINWLTY